MSTRNVLRLALLSVLCGLFVLTASAASCSVSVGGGGDESGTPDTIIQSVTMTKATKGDTYDPGPATTVFSPEDVVHAVVAIKNAPKDTKFSARWTAVDVGSAATPGEELAVFPVTTGGTRNLDMNFSHDGGLPPGKYQFEISVNGQVEKTVAWSVR